MLPPVDPLFAMCVVSYPELWTGVGEKMDLPEIISSHQEALVVGPARRVDVGAVWAIRPQPWQEESSRNVSSIQSFSKSLHPLSANHMAVTQCIYPSRCGEDDSLKFKLGLLFISFANIVHEFIYITIITTNQTVLCCIYFWFPHTVASVTYLDSAQGMFWERSCSSPAKAGWLWCWELWVYTSCCKPNLSFATVFYSCLSTRLIKSVQIPIPGVVALLSICSAILKLLY